ncbi:MAG: RelA/SpoT domain-containing protein [Parvibaculum sp.]|nr:RelA/SpoT domain-containing protein [Parvibaculum sp.]
MKKTQPKRKFPRPSKKQISELIDLYTDSQHEIKIFMDSVVNHIGTHPDLKTGGKNIIHSYRCRLKDKDHLSEKIIRKSAEKKIDAKNFFKQITDLAGVRILHLFQEDFGAIDTIVRKKVSSGDWIFAERPKAYTWDPEAAAFFEQFDLAVSQKSTSYTSVHYLVQPKAKSHIYCEIQVRTLFEEIWGEVDHQINYPKPTDHIACKEQIKVLSKIVGAGSRLLDSIKRVHQNTQQ